MRVPIILAAILTCTASMPTKLLQPYPVIPVDDHSSEVLATAIPTIPAGDINGAIKDAKVEADDRTRSAIDNAQQIYDKSKEIQGQAVNSAEEQAWRAVDAVSTATARLDGATAAAAPAIAKSLVAQRSLIIEPYISESSQTTSTFTPNVVPSSEVYASSPTEVGPAQLVSAAPLPAYSPVASEYALAPPRYVLRQGLTSVAGYAPAYSKLGISYSAPAIFNIAPREFADGPVHNSPFYSYPSVVSQDLYSTAVESIPQPYYFRGEMLTQTL